MKNSLVSSYHYEEERLAGFFSWLKKAVNTVGQVLSSIPAFSSVGSILVDFTNDDGDFFGIHFGTIVKPKEQGFSNSAKTIVGGVLINPTKPANPTNSNSEVTDIPLTATEENILDQWMANFLKQLTKIINDLNSAQINVETFINAANEAINWCEGTEQFIDGGINPSNYTEDMITVRNAFLEMQVITMTELLADIIAKKAFSLTLNSVNKKLNKSWLNTFGYNYSTNVSSYTGDSYALAYDVTPTDNTIPPKQPNPIFTIDPNLNLGDNIPTKGNTQNDIDNTIEDLGNDIINTIEDTGKESKKHLWWLLLPVGAYVLHRASKKKE